MSELAPSAKQLLLVSLLARSNAINSNAKALLKELVVCQDSRLGAVVELFEARSGDGKPSSPDSAFLSKIIGLV